MRTKSINDIQNQAARIQAAGGWKSLGDKWDYDKYMSLAHKLREIKFRYFRAIGEYQREVEGMTKDYQDAEWDTIASLKYPASVYMDSNYIGLER